MPEDSLPRQPKTGTGGRRSAAKLTSSSTKNRYRRTPFRRKVDILVNPPLTIYFCYQKVSGNKNAWVAEFRFGKCRQAYFFQRTAFFLANRNLPTHYPTSTFVKWVFLCFISLPFCMR